MCACMHAHRQKQELNKERAQELIKKTLDALDALLATVPEDVLTKRWVVCVGCCTCWLRIYDPCWLRIFFLAAYFILF